MTNLVSFPSGDVTYYFNSPVSALENYYGSRDIILVTDSNIAAHYPQLLSNYKHLIIPAGEHSKTPATIQNLAERLITLQVSRKSMLVGIGGGVVTDITGFLASVYMRGIALGFIPTTLLGMVDASIGGKNGVNLGLHKNMLGTILQPEFILFDTAFLTTLPDEEWSNGFAEIVKYACLFDRALFEELEQHNVDFYKQNTAALAALVKTCADWKNKTVIADEHESGQRKLLNFGHTAAHAIENLYEISHGKAVAIGMMIAARLSEEINKTSPSITQRLAKMLHQYGLPTTYPIDVEKAMALLKMDKKRNNDSIDYILLEGLGNATITPLSFLTLEKAIASCAQ